MTKNLIPWTAALAIAASLAFTSCAYDPYYSSAGGYYSSGYGDGYGYGGSNFSTSLFVSTGDPRWGYDPYCYSYYDYRSRRYYDPYLYGYYPIGYRPPVIYGAPHPHGWRPGHGYCPPPRTVRNVTVVNYRNRESSYRNSNYSWAKQVHQRPNGDRRIENRRPDHRTYNRSGGSDYRQSGGGNGYYRPDSGSYQSRDYSNTNRTLSEPRPYSRNNSRLQGQERNRRIEESRSGLPSESNTPVVRPQSRQSESGFRNSRKENRTRQSPEPSLRGRNPSPQPDYQKERGSSRREEARPSKEERKALRSLGEG